MFMLGERKNNTKLQNDQVRGSQIWKENYKVYKEFITRELYSIGCGMKWHVFRNKLPKKLQQCNTMYLKWFFFFFLEKKGGEQHPSNLSKNEKNEGLHALRCIYNYRQLLNSTKLWFPTSSWEHPLPPADLNNLIATVRTDLSEACFWRKIRPWRSFHTSQHTARTSWSQAFTHFFFTLFFLHLVHNDNNNDCI